MDLLLVFILAISLSMDAFSLSLAYGTFGICKRKCLFLSFIVGVFHFFMPLVGMIFGNIILGFIGIDPDVLVFFVLLIIGFQMFFSSFGDDDLDLNVGNLFLFAFAVSIDSFSVGLTLLSIYDNFWITASIFALCSCFFTFFGLCLGSKIKKLVGKVSTMIGGVCLFLIGILYIV